MSAGALNLPVADTLPALCDALASGSDAILAAPPGSGKTTLAPLALLNAPWMRNRQILMLEPRRMAARAAAWRMADLLGESVGRTIGFHVRLERVESARTRLLVLTEGVLNRRLLRDPELAGTGLVIFDEFHERSLHADLALALCRDIQRSLRPDLRLVFMSATLDLGSMTQALEPIRVIEAEGRQYPVETRAAGLSAVESLSGQVARVCLRALREQDAGVLAFLPGEREIRQTEQRLKTHAGLPADTDLHPLYGALPRQAQEAALRPPPPGRRKLVLATSIAESSLTIEGIGAVVDSGWMRVSRFSPATGMERLETLRVSRDRAAQRRGRAGRLGPGLCYRLWDSVVERQLAPAAAPEIESADLAATVLAVADWGVSDPAGLPWLTPPPAAAWAQSVALLQALDALDERGRITPHGRRLVQLPMHPRLAHMVERAAMAGAAETALLLAAFLSERPSPVGPPERRSADLDGLLDAVRHRRPDLLAASSVQRIRRLAQVWLPMVGGSRDRQPADAGACLAWAYPDRLARRRGARGEHRYLLTGGRGASLRRDDPLALHEWLVVAELDDSEADAAIRLAAPLAPDVVEARFASRITRRTVLDWDRRQRAVAAVEIESLGAIPLRERPLAAVDAEAVCGCLCAGIRIEGIESLDWSPAARQLRGRLGLLHRLLPEQGWPDSSCDALDKALEAWLGPRLSGLRTFAQVLTLDLQAALLDWIGPQRRRDLGRLAPTHVDLPGGRRARLDYARGDSPVLAIRIQEAFGLRDTPRIAGGRVAVLMHLLSPARRPVQITSDLASFWRTGYAQARRDLRGRYPRHAWPENPV